MSIEAPEPKRFDLIAALANRTYATETVTIFLDEALMYEYAKTAEAADWDPANEEKQKARDEMLDLFKGIALKVTVKSVPFEQEQIVFEEVEKEFPSKYGPFGGDPLPNPEQEEALNLKLWTLSIAKIEAPDGSSLVPSEADVLALRRQAPIAALKAIADAIKGLNEKTRSGYDTIVKDPDFLSQPSLTE